MTGASKGGSMLRISLEQLLSGVREQALPVTGHSGKIVPGGVFVVLPAPVPQWKMPENEGGERYLAEVLALPEDRGPAHIVISEEQLPLLEGTPCRCTVTVCPSTREALGDLAAASFGTEERMPKVVGITGTNGKTTESYLLESLFSSLGKKVGIVGTVEYRWPGSAQAAPLTTPGCVELHSMLAEMYAAGTEWVFMEVSSHALDQLRVAGIPFSGALITNLTQDHLDYHETFEHYFDSKARLFLPEEQGGLPYGAKAGAYNADDRWCRRLGNIDTSFVAYGIKEKPLPGMRHLLGSILSLTPQGLRLSMEFEGREWELSSPLVGGFNAMNLLGAQAMALALGMPVEALQNLSSFAGVPGRLERIENTRGLDVFVDYAHTPDALVKAIDALRDAGFARIVTLFGCGGNRDRTKRPLMGEAVAEHADIAVLTSDNPRHEDPEAIMDDVVPGLKNCRETHREADRKKALALALDLLKPGDALLVAGKGHETYQQIGDLKRPFSDQQTLRELMR